MSIQIRYFASLREHVGRDRDTLDAGDIATVADVWAKINRRSPLPSNTLVAVNQEYANPERPVQDGDEIAFFPPVTGG